MKSNQKLTPHARKHYLKNHYKSMPLLVISLLHIRPSECILRDSILSSNSCGSVRKRVQDEELSQLHTTSWSLLDKLINLPSLKLTASLHLKMDGWNNSFLLGWSIFRGELLVFREGMSSRFLFLHGSAAYTFLIKFVKTIHWKKFRSQKNIDAKQGTQIVSNAPSSCDSNWNLRPRSFSSTWWRTSQEMVTFAKLGATLPETNVEPKICWFPIGISFSRGLFSGDMLVSGRVHQTKNQLLIATNSNSPGEIYSRKFVSRTPTQMP